MWLNHYRLSKHLHPTPRNTPCFTRINRFLTHYTTRTYYTTYKNLITLCTCTRLVNNKHTPYRGTMGLRLRRPRWALIMEQKRSWRWVTSRNTNRLYIVNKQHPRTHETIRQVQVYRNTSGQANVWTHSATH